MQEGYLSDYVRQLGDCQFEHSQVATQKALQSLILASTPHLLGQIP